MSGTEYDLTANFQLKKPWIDADDDIWGIHLNQNMDLLDNLLQTRGFAQGYLPLSGGIMGGMLTLFADPVGRLDAATKQYTDAAITQAGGAYLSLATGGTVNGPVTVTRLNVSTIPFANTDGSPPTGSVKGDLYNNGGFVCVAP